MAGLMIQGDPGGWSDVGGSLGALAARLETGLSDADAFGAQALARSWYGPAAAAFSAHWAARRPRYEDLIVLVRRASRAILAYAHTLEDMRARAANLESVWCGVGLHVLYSGEGFMLPPGLESMPPHAQVSLRQALSESARDVEFLGADCVAAATELAAVLVPVIALLEDFALIELNIIRGIGAEFLGEARSRPDTRSRNPSTQPRSSPATRRTTRGRTLPSSVTTCARARQAERSAGGSPAAGGGPPCRRGGWAVSDVAVVLDHAASVVAWGYTGWTVVHDATTPWRSQQPRGARRRHRLHGVLDRGRRRPWRSRCWGDPCRRCARNRRRHRGRGGGRRDGGWRGLHGAVDRQPPEGDRSLRRERALTRQVGQRGCQPMAASGTWARVAWLARIR